MTEIRVFLFGRISTKGINYTKPLIMIVLCMYLILPACQNKINSKKVESLKTAISSILGEQLILPTELRIYKPFSNYLADSLDIFNASQRIYSYVNVSCATCVRNINFWSDLIPELRKYDVPIILICRSDDEFELFQYLCETGSINEFPYPFVLDVNNEFNKLNTFMNEIDDFKTVLTNDKNAIILIGNPTTNEEIRKLYLKNISP